MRQYLALLIFFVTSTEQVDVVWIPSPNYGPRIDKGTGQLVDKPCILVMHYTACNLSETLDIFRTKGRTSAHYTVAENGTIYQHVDEKNRAWHAGVAQWKTVRDVNTYSIGIEHVNLGYKDHPDDPEGIVVPGSPRQWYRFEKEQIRASIRLVKEIVQRYDLKPGNIVGHGDAAVGRKVDPGPLYPWEVYAEQGIGAWIFGRGEKTNCTIEKMDSKSNKRVLQMQKKLYAWGYTDVPTDGKFDNKTRQTVTAFQMHYRQENISGDIDNETLKMIDDLLKKYPS